MFNKLLCNKSNKYMKLILSYAYFNFKFFRLIIIIISSEYKTAQNPVNKQVFFFMK